MFLGYILFYSNYYELKFKDSNQLNKVVQIFTRLKYEEYTYRAALIYAEEIAELEATGYTPYLRT